MSEEKAREFWIKKGWAKIRGVKECDVYNVCPGYTHTDFDEIVHVIEKSAFDSLQKENEALKAKIALALAEFPCGCTDEQCDYCFTKDKLVELGE